MDYSTGKMLEEKLDSIIYLLAKIAKVPIKSEAKTKEEDATPI